MKRKQDNSKSRNTIIVGVALAFLCGMFLTAAIYKFTQPDLLPTQITGGTEIERKWLLDKENIPVDLAKEAVGTWQITQTYLNFSPEIRVRKVVDKNNEISFTMTVKSDMSVDGLTREEKEWFISEDEYEYLLEKQEGQTIQKTRYRVSQGGLNYEYDIFHNQLEGLAYLEIEFTDESKAREFTDPDYVVKDVTSDKRYKNQELAQNGIPKD